MNLLKFQSLSPFLGKINRGKPLRLKQTLKELSALVPPNCSKCLPWFGHERENQAPGMFVQEHGGKCRPIFYCSMQLDSDAQAYPNCNNATAATAKLVDTSADLTFNNDIYLQCLRAALSLAHSEMTQYFSASRLTSYVIFLDPSPNLHLKHCCNILNLASYYLCLRKASPLRGNNVPFHDTLS